MIAGGKREGGERLEEAEQERGWVCRKEPAHTACFRVLTARVRSKGGPQERGQQSKVGGEQGRGDAFFREVTWRLAVCNSMLK